MTPTPRDLLGVIAFFPQGINEDNPDWLFPTIVDRRKIFDKFCLLSLTYRNDGFTTMLAPLRDYLCPKDPMSSPLLNKIKECYFTRLSVHVDPDKPNFEESRWIISEDVNVEHLINVFTSIDADSVCVWDACCNFLEHLYWHKPRLAVLGPRIEDLPDDHPSKLRCLVRLSWTFDSVGNSVECKRLLDHSLKLWRERGDDSEVAQTLRYLANANRRLGLHGEGIRRVREALEIYDRLNDRTGQTRCLRWLAWLLYGDKQYDAAEEAAARAIDLGSETGDQYRVCQCYRLLGDICRSKGKIEEAIDHFENSFKLASEFNWDGQLSRNHHCMAQLFYD